MLRLFKKNRSRSQVSKPKIVWRCDYTEFVFYDEELPYLEMIDTRTGEAFITVGKGDEFGDLDTSTVEAAIQSGLDVLHSAGGSVTYCDKTDEELGFQFGEYGSKSEWLNPSTEKKFNL